MARVKLGVTRLVETKVTGAECEVASGSVPLARMLKLYWPHWGLLYGDGEGRAGGGWASQWRERRCRWAARQGRNSGSPGCCSHSKKSACH